MSSMVYEWGRTPFNVNAIVSPQVVGETIEGIVQEHDACTPEMLVDASRPEDSPTHNLFEWNNTEAARKWRNHQARSVISSISVTVLHDDTEVKAPAFISVRKQQDTPSGYRPVSVVMNDPAMAEAALAEAMSKLKAIRQRYEAIKVLSPVWDAIAQVAAD